MSDEPISEFMKCRVCDAGMRAHVAPDHMASHRDAGDLIRFASQRERRELAGDDEAGGPEDCEAL